MNKTHIIADNIPGYKMVLAGCDGAKFVKIGAKISVIVSVAKEKDGKNWLHLSFAHPSRKLTYDEQAEVKRLFVGDENYAIAVFPPIDKHVNIHPHCLHLWSCMEGHPLPEFSGFIGGQRSI